MCNVRPYLGHFYQNPMIAWKTHVQFCHIVIIIQLTAYYIIHLLFSIFNLKILHDIYVHYMHICVYVYDHVW